MDHRDLPPPPPLLTTAAPVQAGSGPAVAGAPESSSGAAAPLGSPSPLAAVAEVGNAGPGSSADVAAGVGPGGSADLGNLAALPLVFNNLFVRRACIPSANGHFSARALARYYASLARAGAVPPPHPGWETSREAPKGPAKQEASKARGGLLRRGGKKGSVAGEGSDLLEVGLSSEGRLFDRPADQVFAAVTGVGPYSPLVASSSQWGLGFGRFFRPGQTTAEASDNGVIAFGHSGMGGSIAFCDPEHDFSIAVTINKMTVAHAETKAVVRLVCAELDVPVPASFLAQPPPEAQGR
jgi:aarF domain-containing kinase